ncbi:MAG: enoyl-CoA hydratase/isomerase family protein [Elstera sp.]
MSNLILEQKGPVACLTLNRPEIHNAFDEHLIAALTEAVATASADPSVRIILLSGAGKSFSAGGDLGWMRRMATYSADENLADAQGLARLMATIDTSPKPVIARVHGSAYAGGLGLVACADIAIGVPEAQFAITEVKLGLIPAVISPYLVRAMGVREARRWCLTAQRFSATEAHRLGLLHAVVPAETLDAVIDAEIEALLAAAPEALADTKRLLKAVDRPLDESVIAETAQRIAVRRATPEAREGLAAFFDKRSPTWVRE